MSYIHKTYCRVCGGQNLEKVLDLGEMPNANSFLKLEDIGSEEKYPLVVYFCKDCTLLQLMDVVDPSTIWNHYDYLTGASKPLADHFVKLGNRLTAYLSKGDLVVDIGGNDGTFLANLKDKFRVVNVEPAQNIALISEEKGVNTWNGYFTSQLAETMVKNYGKAKLILASNVLAHIDDIRDVFYGIELLLDRSGTAVVEIHWVGNLIGEGGFDQIYHEHLCYFSFRSFFKLVSLFDLKIVDVEFDSVHGQSMRVFIEKGRIQGDYSEPNANTWGLHELLFLKERKLGLNKIDTFLEFSKKVERVGYELLYYLYTLKGLKKRIVGYGAPAKGNTLMNFLGLDKTIIDCVVDTTPLKQGKYTPGSHLPIYPRESIENPDYFLLLAWNYADAIIAKEDEFRKSGGKFIIPAPEVKII